MSTTNGDRTIPLPEDLPSEEIMESVIDEIKPEYLRGVKIIPPIMEENNHHNEIREQENNNDHASSEKNNSSKTSESKNSRKISIIKPKRGKKKKGSDASPKGKNASEAIIDTVKGNNEELSSNSELKHHNIQKNSNSSHSHTNEVESITIDDKMKILEDLGKPELIALFKDWKPRPSKRKRSAPLDQRVTITVTHDEKSLLDAEIQELKKLGDGGSVSQMIRSRAMATVDINGWKNIALKELQRLEEIEENKKELQKRKLFLANAIEDDDDDEEVGMYLKEEAELESKLNALLAKTVRRSVRLVGRMSLAECENIKWRAERLCIPASDYLRFMIFNLEPGSSADAHMSLDARKRFYVSIIDVANNGWGQPNTIFQCTQCANYLSEIEKLQDRVKQLESFI